jgi:integrase
LRTFENKIDIVSKLYNAVPKYEALSYNQKEEMRAYLMMIVMTAHRHGELRQLTIEDCYLDRKMIIAPKTIEPSEQSLKSA